VARSALRGTARVPRQGWSLSLDDLLTTRTMEIAVHSDDLAVSVGVAAPNLSSETLTPSWRC